MSGRVLQVWKDDLWYVHGRDSATGVVWADDARSSLQPSTQWAALWTSTILHQVHLRNWKVMTDFRYLQLYVDIFYKHASHGLVLWQPQYRVGQIKRGQLTFLLVTTERIYKIKRFFGRYKLDKATSDMTPILSHWKRNTLEGATSFITYDADMIGLCAKNVVLYSRV